MKNRIFLALSLCAGAFLFTSCWWLFSDSGSLVTVEGSASWTYDSSTPWVKVDTSVKTVRLYDVPSGSRIYLAKTNISDKQIDRDYVQYVSETGTKGINLSNKGESVSSVISSVRSVLDEDSVESGASGGNEWHCYIPKDIPSTKDAGRSVNVVVEDEPTEYCTSAGYKCGDYAYFYIDTTTDSSGSISGYKLAKCYLRSQGSYCNVWVVDGYYSTDSGTKCYYYYDDSSSEGVTRSTSYTVDTSCKVTSKQVAYIGNKFETMYKPITNLFGSPCEKIYNMNTGNWVDMQYYDDTWYEDCAITDPVNIVIYDIASDGKDGGTMGYFWAKDYFSNTEVHCSDYSSDSSAKYSNEGKFFYVDSYFVNEEEEETIYTLAHEFQHMCEYNEKAVKHNISLDTAYQEMQSMICEDVMASMIANFSDTTSSDAGPIVRLPHFAGSYIYCGLGEYSEPLTLSYATAYAFGAFLIRNYGGTDFIKALVTNKYANMESVLAAIKSATGKSMTVEEVLRDFALACTCEESSATNFPTFNLDASLTSSSGCDYYDYIKSTTDTYYYPIDAIEMFDLNSMLGTNYSGVKAMNGNGRDGYLYYYSYTGPVKYLYSAVGELQPYGMTLHYLGTKDSNSYALINFGLSKVNKNQCLYIVVDN